MCLSLLCLRLVFLMTTYPDLELDEQIQDILPWLRPVIL